MKNWRTTAVGLVGAIWVAVEPMLTSGEIDWKQIATAAFIAALGIFSKDAGVTGTGK